MAKASPRMLKPRQRCQIWIHDIRTGANELLFETNEVLLEAPNWAMDGEALLLNGDGHMWRLHLGRRRLERIEITGIPPLNNDHVLDPDGEHIFMSAYDDWQIYRAPIAGGRGTQITGKEGPQGLLHFLHGVSPDGRQLAFVGIRIDEAEEAFKLVSADIFTVGADGRGYRQITHANAPADGPEYSPDGEWIYFNTEAFSPNAQIARMRPDGSEVERLISSETVDWFPHISPNGRACVYLSYPAGTSGHPADLNVRLMLVRDGQWGRPALAAELFGGQGTINVNSWAPDSTRFAYVAYPIGE
jgi:TolB protein